MTRDETISLIDFSGHATLTRNVANITMDLDNVETVDLQAKGGADIITVNDLTGTDVSKVKIDLGGADGAPDTIVLHAASEPVVLSRFCGVP